MAEVKQDEDDWKYKLAQELGLEFEIIAATICNENLLKHAQVITKDRALYCNICECFKNIGIDADTPITSEIAQEIKNDPQSYAFLKHLNDEMGGTDIDSVEDISDQLKGVQDRHQSLEPKCNDQAYQKCLNKFYIEYFGASMVNLCLSWWKIHESNKKLKYASSKLQELKTRLNDIKSKYVEPVIQYHHKIKVSGVIDNLIEYRSYETMISSALDLLNSIQNECKTQQTVLTNDAQQNASGVWVMGHSSYTSWTFASLFPEVGTALKVLSVIQGGTAVVHGLKAKESYDLCQEFNVFEKQLMDIIVNLKEIKRSMKECEEQYIARIALWDYQQVSQWVKALGPQYVSIGDVFEKDKVTGMELVDMNHDDLEALGMKTRLYRKRLLTKIAELQH